MKDELLRLRRENETLREANERQDEYAANLHLTIQGLSTENFQLRQALETIEGQTPRILWHIEGAGVKELQRSCDFIYETARQALGKEVKDETAQPG